MSVETKKRKKGATHYAVFSWQGGRVWEKAGSERREAERLEKRRRAEVANGTYVPAAMSKATTVGQYLRAWLLTRENRTAKNDRSRMKYYVLPKEWFVEMPIADVRPRHVIQLIHELKKTIGHRTRKKLTPKTVANTYTALRTMFRDARIAELTSVDPCVIPKGLITHKTVSRRGPYELVEIRPLVRDERVEPNKRVWNALLFFTGLRTGEAAGRRFRDWKREARPLSALEVDTQFNDQMLKTEQQVAGEHARRVPVHPELEGILDWWWREGFAQFYRRRPKLDDFIVPLESDVLACHTNSSAYRVMRTSCKRTEVPLRGVHSSRRSFISHCRRAGCAKDVLERITHNASGDIIDIYTFWDWKPLCDVVLCLDLDRPECRKSVDGLAQVRGTFVEPRGIEPLTSSMPWMRSPS